jgi:hypothetical protein
MRRAVAFYRSAVYSPRQHLENDRAILDAVVQQLGALGWSVRPVPEEDAARGRFPDAELYLNMCQGPEAARQLEALLPRGTLCLNPPAAVLACHRHRLVRRLTAAGVPFPRTILLRTRGPDAAHPPTRLVTNNGYPVWVKRGDVHAQAPDDVVCVPLSEVGPAMARFAARGIETVAVQAHVPGPVVKFYGVAGGRFFHCYASDSPDRRLSAGDADRLQEVAERAARALGLVIYGGDAVLAAPGAPVLVDLNDWPSFAPVREAAAAAIARYAHQCALRGSYACSTR